MRNLVLSAGMLLAFCIGGLYIVSQPQETTFSTVGSPFIEPFSPYPNATLVAPYRP